MENAPLRAPGRAKAPQTIGKQSKFIGPGGVRSAREPRKSSKITFFVHFGDFPSRINKNGEFLQFSVNFAKRGSLGGPAPRSLFFLRNIKVSEPPYFLEISWTFMKFAEIS